MPPIIATAIFFFGILGLFWLDRDGKVKTSKALWIPVMWLLLAGSRNVSEWLNLSPVTDSPDRYLDGNPLDRAVFTGLLALGVTVLVARERRLGRLLRANGLILLFFCYGAVSILWSDYPDVSFKRWVKALGDFVMILIVLTDPDPSGALKRLLARTSFLLVPLSILFIKYYPDLGRSYLRWTWQPVWTGVTTNKNTLGMSSMVFGLGAAWRFLQALRRHEGHPMTGTLIAHGTILAMVLWLLAQVNSVTSLSCFLMAGGFLAASGLPALVKRPAVVHCLVAGALSVSFGALFLNIGTGLVENLGRDATLTGRTELWNQLLGMRANPLFGAGFESFWLGPRLEKLWSMYWFHPNEAHNGYLEVFLNLGWTGVALLALVMIKGYRNSASAFRRDHELGRLRLAYFLAGAAYSFTEAGFRLMNPVWIVFLFSITVVPEAVAAEAPEVSEDVHRSQRCEQPQLAPEYDYEEVV